MYRLTSNCCNPLYLNKKFVYSLSAIILFLLANFPANALTYKVPRIGNTVGEYTEIEAEQGDTLTELAEQYDIGVYEMLRANHRLSHKALKAGTKVIIPARFHLPPGPRKGMVLNLAEMRIFYYHPEEDLVSTYPVGVGRQGWSTPVGDTKIISKKMHPAWHPPASIRREEERRGKTLPSVVPAGPHNPLGQYAMHLGISGILIHGTNRPSSIGLKSSHGCIRMYANDIKELFLSVPIQTTVRIINELSHKQ